MPGEATPRLRARGVTVRFGPTTALSAVDLDVTPGEVHAVIGENGAGKSTLMKVLSGAVAPDAGELWIDGEPYAPASPLDAAGRGVAMVYQELSLVPHLGAAENIALGREPLRRGLLNTREMRARARAALAALGHADLDPDLPVRRLPPAVQQIVEIARALRLAGTRVLVLDEPTSSLAADDVERLFEAIGRLRDGGLSIIYISHVLEEVRRVADRFTVLRDGRTVGTGRVSDVSMPSLISMMAGREVTQIFPDPRASRGRRSSNCATWPAARNPRRRAWCSTPARCWASGGWWGPAARSCCAPCSDSTRCVVEPSASAPPGGRRPRGNGSRRVLGCSARTESARGWRRPCRLPTT